MGNIRAGTLMKFTKLLIAYVSPGFLHKYRKASDRPILTPTLAAFFIATQQWKGI